MRIAATVDCVGTCVSWTSCMCVCFMWQECKIPLLSHVKWKCRWEVVHMWSMSFRSGLYFQNNLVRSWSFWTRLVLAGTSRFCTIRDRYLSSVLHMVSVFEITGWSWNTNRFRRIYRMYPSLIKEYWSMWARKWLDLQTLEYQLVKPKNLPDHCFEL
jgi:hypothetical protein